MNRWILKSSIIVLGLALAGNRAQAQQNTEPSRANQLRKHWGEAELLPRAEKEDFYKYIQREAESGTRVLTSIEALGLRMGRTTEPQDNVLRLVTGYSGADYEDKAALKATLLNDFRSEIAADPKKNYFYIFGGTNDGFGRPAYDVIEALKKEFPNTRIAAVGIVADQSVAYHFEGLAKGWGDTIHAGNNPVVLINTYFTADGSGQVWEVKESPNQSSRNVELLSALPYAKFSASVYGGAEIAFREIIEWLAKLSQLKSSGKDQDRPYGIQVDLGWQTGKALKDKGPRAAEMLAYILNRHPKLVPAGTAIEFRDRAQNGRVYKFSELDQSPSFQNLLADLKNSPAEIAVIQSKLDGLKAAAAAAKSAFKADENNAQLKAASASADTALGRAEARLNFFKAFGRIDTIVIEVLEGELRRIQEEFDRGTRIDTSRLSLIAEEALAGYQNVLSRFMEEYLKRNLRSLGWDPELGTACEAKLR